MGNKWRKLKYNLLESKRQGFRTLLTFGGAYSNLIYAVASAGKEFDFETIGIIRGDELKPDSNPTLKYASEMGMHLHFVSRNDYLEKGNLIEKFGQNSYILPEGGTNLLALKGVAELLEETENQINPTHVCVSIGTGGTFAGLISAQKKNVTVVGVPVLKGFEFNSIHIPEYTFPKNIPFEIWTDYHFGGYGKYNEALINFMQTFENEYNIPLEQVYTAKLFYGVFDKIKSGYFTEKSKIVIVHTGGLQGRIIT